MRNPARTCLEWYRSPEQFLLRIEIAWFRRWLLRGWGLLFLILALLAGLSGVFQEAGFAFSAWGALIMTSPFSVSCGSFYGLVWAWLVKRRTFGWLGGTRLRDLLLTPAGAESLWPAALAAPALFPVVASGFVLAGAALGKIAGDGGFADARQWAAAAIVWPCALAATFLHSLAVAAFTARRALPRGGWIRILLWGWIASWFVGTVSLVLNLGAMIVLAAAAGLMPWGLGGAFEFIDRHPVFSVPVFAAVFLVVCAFIARKNLASLRSDRAMDLLRLSLEAEVEEAHSPRERRDSRA